MHSSIKAAADPETGVVYRAPRRQTRFGHARQIQPILDHRNVVKHVPSTFQLACEWIAPWSVFSYPGHMRMILAILGDSVTWSSVANWKRERANPGVWAVRALQAYIRSRCAVGLRLADALEPYAERRALSDKRMHLRGLR